MTEVLVSLVNGWSDLGKKLIWQVDIGFIYIYIYIYEISSSYMF